MLLPSIAAPLRHSSLTAVSRPLSQKLYKRSGSLCIQSFSPSSSIPLSVFPLTLLSSKEKRASPLLHLFPASLTKSFVRADRCLDQSISKHEIFFSFLKQNNSNPSSSIPFPKPIKMCSVYVIKYDCGCAIQEVGVVHCAHRGTSTCPGVRQQPRRREGYNCPKHGG